MLSASSTIYHVFIYSILIHIFYIDTNIGRTRFRSAPPRGKVKQKSDQGDYRDQGYLSPSIIIIIITTTTGIF